MTARTTPPFRADHVGSFLRPKYLLDAREKRARGEITPAELRVVEDRAIAEVVRTPKVTIPSSTMLHFPGGRAGISTEHYPDLEPFYQDVADACGAELRSLAAAGCMHVQMDDTNLAYLCDPKMQEAARHAPLEQLALSPQCGFSSTVRGNAIAMEAQAAKLRLIVEVATEVWGSA